MEKPDCGKATKLLHQIIDTITFREKSDNVTLFELYPIINKPSIQPIPKVFKSHLFGIFPELGLLFQYSGTSLRYTSAFIVVKSFDHQKLSMQHIKQLNTRDIRQNQHMNKY